MLFTCNFFILILSQKAFNEQFYEEDENEKPVFEDDLDDIGQYLIPGYPCPLGSTTVQIIVNAA